MLCSSSLSSTQWEEGGKKALGSGMFMERILCKDVGSMPYFDPYWI
jgi:hypothetical protein